MVDPKKQLEFHEKQSVALDALLREIAACVPRGWRIAVLGLDVAYSPHTKVRSIKHRLRNPVTNAEVRTFPQSLFHAATALHIVFTEYGQAWIHGAFTLTYDSKGRMRERKANYKYGHVT